jgi:hypothetical protein
MMVADKALARLMCFASIVDRHALRCVERRVSLAMAIGSARQESVSVPDRLQFRSHVHGRKNLTTSKTLDLPG